MKLLNGSKILALTTMVYEACDRIKAFCAVEARLVGHRNWRLRGLGVSCNNVYFLALFSYVSYYRQNHEADVLSIHSKLAKF